jgi:hypothetical protein
MTNLRYIANIRTGFERLDGNHEKDIKRLSELKQLLTERAKRVKKLRQLALALRGKGKFPRDFHAIAYLEKTCFACPAQWEGFTINSEPVYIRYRNGYLAAYIGPKNAHFTNNWLFGNGCRQIFGRDIGDPMDGAMSDFEMYKHLRNVAIVVKKK